ncbi:MAG: hypothetical protein Q8R15_01465 [Candidatus Micrarchaeota archaeon]|nr:hypothetical protein [Candidatus Micrarchaeota archaeon]
MRMLYFLLFLLVIFSFISLATAADAVAAYRSNTGSCSSSDLNCVKVRFWNSLGYGNWSSEVELASASSEVRDMKIKYSPLSSKIILVTLSDDGYLDSYVCTANCTVASAWVFSSNVGRIWSTAPSTHYVGFDVAFETATGNAVIVYSVLDSLLSRDLAYKVLPANATSFDGIIERYIDNSLSSSDLRFNWVELDAKPNSTSSEIALLASELTSTKDVVAWVWNATSWGHQQVVSTNANSPSGKEAMALRYASDGSKAMAIATEGGAGLIETFYWNGISWVNSSFFSLDDEADGKDARKLTLKADPSSDDLQAMSVDSGKDLTTAYWDGSSWSEAYNIFSNVDSSSPGSVDFEWNPTGSTGILVWDTDFSSSKLNYTICSPQCDVTTATTFTSYAGTGASLDLFGNPTSLDLVNILGLRLNSNFDIGSFRYDGTSFTNYGDSQITGDARVITYRGYDLDFQNLGYLAVNLSSPIGNNSQQPQNQTFSLIANVTCVSIKGNGYCGVVNGALRYNYSSPTPDLRIQGNGFYSSPFYTLQPNPQTCGELNSSSPSCMLNFTINTTGPLRNAYALDVLFYSNTNGVSRNNTISSTINIFSSDMFAITITDALSGVHFGNLLDPGSNYNPAINNSNDAYNVTCLYAFGTCHITIKANSNLTSGDNMISAGNITWATINKATISQSLGFEYSEVTAALENLANQTLYFWLSIPARQVAGNYGANFTIQGEANE